MTSAQPPPTRGEKTTTPWCSVIIPTLNEERYLGATLQRLTGAPQTTSFEFIVADGGSTDATLEIARRYGARVVHAPRGRAAQMNAGALAATGRSFLFLHADTLPPADFTDHFPVDTEVVPACFRLRFRGQESSVFLRLYSYCTRFDIDAFRFGDQALWVLRRDFEAVGGYPADWQLLEDNYLVRRLRRHCGGFRILPDAVTTSPRKYVRNGFVYTQLVYTLLYTLYRCGAGQRALLFLYRVLLK